MKDTIAVKLPLIALAALLAVSIASPEAQAAAPAHAAGSTPPTLGQVHDGANGGVRHRPRVFWVYPGDPSYGWWCGNPAGWYPSVGECFQNWQPVPLY